MDTYCNSRKPLKTLFCAGQNYCLCEMVREQKTNKNGYHREKNNQEIEKVQ